MFKLHPLFLSLIAAQGIIAPAFYSQAATLKPFSPYVNDNKAGVFCVCNGSTQTLSGNQQFLPGLSGAQSFTLRELQGRVNNPDLSLAERPGLDPGTSDYTISVPDWENGGYRPFDVFNSANMIEVPPIGLDTPVPNYVDVKGGQYVNARVAQVSKGTINVEIGQAGAATASATNGWRMAAKQSRLFAATGSGTMNWNADNRLTFTSALPPVGGPYLTLPVDSVAYYKGAFSVTTRNNVTTQFNVTSFETFKSYNSWLIEQLERGQLDTERYRDELDKAVTITSGQIVYGIVAQDPNDEAAQPIGELVVLSADGEKATVTVNKTLEVVNASSAVLAANGGTAIINGKVASTGNGSTDGDALNLLSGSVGINNGVINSGFFNQADGTGVDSGTVGHSSNAVRLEGKSRFTNNGVINVVGSGTGLGIFDGSATNHGNINAGMGNGASGVFVNGDGASFVNAADGTLWLGRLPQNRLTDAVTDTPLSGAVGVNMVADGSAINEGHIVLGSQTQGSAAMKVVNGPNARLQNNGVIDVNGQAMFGPEESIAMIAIDSGNSGLVGNSGTINLNGNNGVGIDAIASSGHFANIYSEGRINVNGSVDPLSGTGNTAVWLRAEEGGSAYARITGPINVVGQGAVGLRADGSGASVYDSATVSGDGANAIAFDMQNGANLTLAETASVNLTGDNSTGIRVTNSGSFFMRGIMTVASGVAMEVIEGAARYFPESAQLTAGGTAAIRVGNNGHFALYGDGIFRNQVTGNGNADAILLDKGAAGLSVDGATLTVNGSGSAINNVAETRNISLTNTYIYARGSGSGIRSATAFDPQGTVTIEPSGGATGYTFANADGSTTDADMLLPHGMVILVGSDGTGIRANTTGKVISEGNIYITTESGGSAIVSQTASEVINRGDIFSWSTAAPVIDLRGGNTVFINEGTIAAQYADTVIVAGGATNDRIALIGGSVLGDVNTGNGTDTLTLTGGTLDGSLTMGNGINNQAFVQHVSLANVSHITTAGGEGSTLSLSEIAASGGSFASDDPGRGVNLGAGWSTLNFYHTDWTLTDNLKLAHSTLNIDSESTLYAGNRVNPVLAGGSSDSLVVNNAGTLDLTNGVGSPGNTLTINGTLNSLNGKLKLASAPGGGSQLSDRLHVNGDVNGTTLLSVTPVADSTGALSDANQNGVIDANEGVSLVQVTGSASARSFALQGGYLAAGPWRYDLYSFAPGSSDASQRQVESRDSQFHDYRLANGLVSNGGASRAAVVPQVPSYLSVPTGLAYYSAATLNDLHNRLGELRQQGENGGEMFLRYTGANMRYGTSQNFKDFGYNFDMDYSALQIGGNIVQLDGDNGSLRGGIAWTRGNSRIRPSAADGYSSTTFDSDTLALYTTWLQNSGFYLDGTLSYSWHRGETDIARTQNVAKIKGKGWSASLESGYPFAWDNGLRLVPSAQLTYLHLGLDSFSDKDNLTVSYDDAHQTIGRVGAKLDRLWSDDSGRQYTPYLRANYYKGWDSQVKTTVGAKGVEGLDQSFRSGKFGQMGEIGVGGTTTFRNNVSLYAEADYRKEIDGNGGKGWGYNAGVRWLF
ncbi:autotransporter outer membrane beta-barrel domain-containing protein [Erwinia sp.]|uniref:autotransporter outer membrane beta-barrel domain-containing protein n=1 Tax=Erwinia citreus TaxID=558 RepID=UPI00289DCD68|nr:autotransporter outer membrane beta-barrel domain-containing protein [Erwinia sp.]